MTDSLITIIVFLVFLVAAVGYYIWFWKRNKLWMLFIAVNSQVAAISNLKQIIPHNYRVIYRWITAIIGLTIIAIMHYRYWKISKNSIDENHEDMH